MPTNLPGKIIEDSAAGTILYFDKYGEIPQEFAANDVAVTIGFFQSAGFDDDAAQVSAMTLLRQAKLDQVPVSQILDTIKGFSNNELSQLVGEVLNNNRVSTSTLGFRVADVSSFQTRQIAA